MKNSAQDSAIIIPTRSRSASIPEILTDLEQAKTTSPVYFCCDISDPQLLKYFFYIKFQNKTRAKILVYKKIKKKTGVVGPLNYAGTKLMKKFRYIIFLGDDNRPVTTAWDTKMVTALKSANKYIGYPNDLLRKEELPTSVVLNSKFVHIVGGFGPSYFTHLYVDDFWKHVGIASNSITYFPDIIVRHNHPATGLVDWDKQYKLLNSDSYYNHGRKAFDDFLNSELANEITDKIKKSMEIDGTQT